MKAKARGQLYLTPLEEKALEKYLKLVADLENPVRIKYLPALAFSIASQRSTNEATKPPGKNWPQRVPEAPSSTQITMSEGDDLGPPQE